MPPSYAVLHRQGLNAVSTAPKAPTIADYGIARWGLVGTIYCYMLEHGRPCQIEEDLQECVCDNQLPVFLLVFLGTIAVYSLWTSTEDLRKQ